MAASTLSLKRPISTAASTPRRSEYQLFSWLMTLTWFGSGKAPQMNGLNEVWVQP